MYIKIYIINHRNISMQSGETYSIYWPHRVTFVTVSGDQCAKLPKKLVWSAE